MPRSLYIAAIARTSTTDLDHDDQDVEGLYHVDGIDDALPDDDAADTALASFHVHQGVEVLDDFEFIVLDPNAKAVLTPEHGEDRDEYDCIKLGDTLEDWMVALV